MKKKTFLKKEKNMNTCYIAPINTIMQRKKAVNHPFKIHY